MTITSRTAIGLLAAAALAAGVMLAAPAPSAPEQEAPSVVLTGGRIITVDERFTIAQAAAVRGDRIVAVGTDQEIAALVGPGTRRIDLRGRAVIPGLIDNHLHLMRAGTTWQREVRWDGVASRRKALEMLSARAKALPASEWVFNLGGWTIEQFADNHAPFTRAELDAAVPDHPVLLQASYYEAYLNSHGLQAMGISDTSPIEPWVMRDAAGHATGRIGEAGFRALVARLPAPLPADVEASTTAMIADLNRSGLTTVGSVGCEPDVLPLYRRRAERHALDLHVFCITGVTAGSPDEVTRALPQIANLTLFQGSHDLDAIAFGESVYGPLHDPMFIPRSDPRPEQLVLWRRIATEIAKNRLPLHVHANLRDTIGAFLDQIEAVNREYPVRNLRWALAHLNQIDASHLARMRELGLYAAVHPWAVINGGINRRVFGDAASDMAPLATIQKSGVLWGFGSDGSRANQILPFTTLSWAVTGRMVGGAQVLRPAQTISREDALIAHTRRNAFLVFQENNLGSIQAGKLADLVVLDRDYLRIPDDQIKDIRPVLTMVGGRVVYEAGAETATR